MDDIKIFVTHTPNSRQIRIQDPLLYHVAAGSGLQTGQLAEDMLADNTGENISRKNRIYCELTTQYWAWKNVEADYYGFCHYRRYFSFAEETMPEAAWGCLSFSYINTKTIQKLCIDEQHIRQKVSPYDFLIAKKIPVRQLFAKSVYEHYKNASELNIKDLELFLDILNEKYPKLQAAAKRYIDGAYFYPCNMFIMKKEIFQEYSDMLFAILEEFERRADMSGYSREGLRTPGHLGERFAGIYYEYLLQKGGYRMGELQMALFSHTQEHTYKRPGEKEIPVVLAADRAYVPVLFTCVKSLTECADTARDYHIYILHTDILKKDMQVFQKELARENIRIDFVDVGEKVDGYRLEAKEHITTETYFRFLILDILKDCQKAVYLDSDTIVRKDVAGLYDLPLNGYLLAAAVDPDFAGQYNGANSDTKNYCDQVLGLKDPYAYAQAGVLVFHIAALKEVTDVSRLFRMADEGNYRYSDQDILNIICEGRIKKLDMAWNMLIDSRNQRGRIIQAAPAGILEAYEQARKRPYIIHYAGDAKPWKDPKEDFAQEFWKTARQTPYYEELLSGIVNGKTAGPVLSAPERAAGLLKRIAKKLLPQGSRIRLAVGRLYWKLK